MSGPVVLLVAMDEEAAPFLARAEETGTEERIGGARLTPLRLAGREVVLVRTGIGMVNAAAAAAVTVTRLTPSALVAAGSAGGLGAGVRVGDVVVGGTYGYTRADATAFGYAFGQVPGMPARYESAAALLEAATPGAEGLTVHVGEVVSGDVFVAGPLVDEVRGRYPAALATDMESTALAQTAYQFGVPFLSVRGISDLCGATEFDEHVDDAADRSAAVVVALLERLD